MFLVTLFAVLLPVVLAVAWAPWKKSDIPTYGPSYLPPFIRGILAAIALGVDEDKFLLGLLNDYGAIVYVPWPMQQYLVLTSKTINSFYSTPQKSLSFLPVRISMQMSVFGGGDYDTRMFTERVFPVHSKGLTKSRLKEPVTRFCEVFADKVSILHSQVQNSASGHVDISINDWVTDTMFDAGLAAIFGQEFLKRAREVQEGHNAFDAAFPLLAGEIVPPFLRRFVKPIRDGILGRDAVASALAEFVQDGTPGLEEGLVPEMSELFKNEKLSPIEAAHLLLGDFWALQANAPFACIWFFCRVLQCPGLLARLRDEIQTAELFQSGEVSYAKLNESLPLMTSCVNETLRLDTSAFSIRIVQEDFLLDVSQEGEEAKRVFLPKNSKVLAATRVPHLTDPVWGDEPERWDPERFVPSGKDEASNVKLAKLLKEMRGFGGGVSQCEGRHLAILELKAALANFIATFDAEPLVAPGSEADYTSLKLKGLDDGKAFAPKKTTDRPGLGAFQFNGDMKFRISLRK